jgi:hypothetical protein
LAANSLEAEGAPEEKSAILTGTLSQIEKGLVNGQTFRTLHNTFQSESGKPAIDQLRSASWLSSDMIYTVYVPTVVVLIIGLAGAVRFFPERVPTRRVANDGKRRIDHRHC